MPQRYIASVEFKSHFLPFIAFGALGLFGLWYVAKSVIAWRRDGSLGVRNRLRWMPLGAAATTALDMARGEDPTDKRAVHQLRNPVVILLWLLVCVAFSAECLVGAVEFLRTGHGFQN